VEIISDRITEDQPQSQIEVVELETRFTNSVQSPAKLTQAQYQEQTDKARAWNLDRERAAQAKTK
jgi:hypothetical protein